MIRAVLIAVVACAWACSGTKQPAPAGSGSAGSGSATGGSKMPKKMPDGDEPGPTFVRGPSLSPANKLLAWLEGQQRDGKPRLVRIPVVLKPATVGFDLRGARLGGAADALTVFANDQFLGIGLDTHAASHCKGQPSCAFWVHGHFRGKVGDSLQFDVTRMESFIEPGAVAAASYAEVEGDSASGN